MSGQQATPKKERTPESQRNSAPQRIEILLVPEQGD